MDGVGMYGTGLGLENGGTRAFAVQTEEPHLRMQSVRGQYCLDRVSDGRRMDSVVWLR